MSGKTVNYTVFRFRIYPTAEQAELIEKTFACCRTIWNLMLTDKIEHYEKTGGYLRNTPAMYKKERPYLTEVDSMALCNVQMQLEKAYKNFWRGKSYGYPKWKTKKSQAKSYTTSLVKSNITVGRGLIKLPKVGYVKAKLHRRIPVSCRIKAATITQDAGGRYYASVMCERTQRSPKPRTNGESIGLVYSNSDFYIDSNGNKAKPPKPYKKAEQRLAFEMHKLSRMESGSSNWQKQKLRVGRAYAHTASVRKDWIEKESTAIAKRCSLVAMEDLDLREMAHNPHSTKDMHDNGWAIFAARLAKKLEENGGTSIKVEWDAQSARTCHRCNYETSDLDLNGLDGLTWICPECGAEHDPRDVFAARAILEKGLRQIQSEGCCA